MKILIVLFTAIISTVVSFTEASSKPALNKYAPWKTGDEREIFPNTFFKKVKEIKGWEIWREETDIDVMCFATKSSNYQLHPKPIFDRSFSVSVPTIVLSKNYQYKQEYVDQYGEDSLAKYNWAILGYHSGDFKDNFDLEWDSNRYFEQYKVVGEKFWTDCWTCFFKNSNKKIEVHILTYEYPEIKVNPKDQYGIIDLIGLNEALEEIESCEH